MPKRTVHDPWLFVTSALLVVGGLLMVGSASSFTAFETGRGPSAFLIRQGLYVMVGMVALLLGMSVRYRSLCSGPLVAVLLGGCVSGLILVLLMPSIGGARRWLLLGPVSLQPSELTKLAVVLFMAWVLSRREERINESWTVPLPWFMVVSALAFLIMIEPDLGSAVVLTAVAGVMLLVAGLRWSWLVVLGAMGGVGFVLSVALWPYRIKRIMSFLDPAGDPLGAGFQLDQSLIAIGRGGLTGVGLGRGLQKMGYVPAPHTDFIFSVIGEELGLAGTGVLLAFLIVFWRGLRAAVRAPDRFGFYLALGITSLLVLQALVNMAVCVGLLPTKGLPLPLISYGGSSLVVSMAAIGLLLNVSQHSS